MPITTTRAQEQVKDVPGPAVTKILLIRHAHSISNAQERLAGAQKCSQLSDPGHRQAKMVADQLAAEQDWRGFTTVYSTSVPRTRQTAGAVSALLGCMVGPELPTPTYGGLLWSQLRDGSSEWPDPNTPLADGAERGADLARCAHREIEQLAHIHQVESDVVVPQGEIRCALGQVLVGPLTRSHAVREVGHTSVPEWHRGPWRASGMAWAICRWRLVRASIPVTCSRTTGNAMALGWQAMKDCAVERSSDRDRLLAKVSELSGVLRAGADAGEDQRLVPVASLRLLQESGLLRALAPKEVGGFGVDPVTELEIIEAVSAVDGSTGWLYWALAGSTARAASMLPESTVPAVFGASFGLIAYDERPYDNRVRVQGAGARVRGRWPFGTGVSYADWVVAVAHLDPSGEKPWPGAEMVAALVPTGKIDIVDEWDAAGLSGTGTQPYVIDDIVVPRDHVWAYPPARPLRGGVYFCARRAAVKHLGFALGVARSSLEEFTAHVGARRVRGAVLPGSVDAELARARFEWESARALAFAEVERMWREAWTTAAVSEESYRRLRAAARFVTEVAVRVCGLITGLGDASLLGRQHILQRNLRDITVAAAHSEVGAATLDGFGADLISGSAR